MEGRIALEERFSTELNSRYWDAKGEEGRNGRDYAQDVERRLPAPEACIAETDCADIDLCIMSLTSPGVQSVVDPKLATAFAREPNDHTHAIVQRYPDRLAALAAVALQDPRGAADELECAVSEVGPKGDLINGYSNAGDGEHAQYLDEEPDWAFWERVSKLNLPVYLHPREPLASQTRYEQMDVAGRWFDDMRLDNAAKLKIGRENAVRLFKLDLATVSESAAAGFAA